MVLILGWSSNGTVFSAARVSVPAGISATASCPPQITLSWTASSGGIGEVSYDIYRNGSHYAYTTSSQYRDVSVYPAMSYLYQVFAVDNAGDRSLSSKAVFATVPVPKEGMTPPSQAAGYTLVYASDFNSLDISQNWTGQFHDWYNSEYGALKPVSSARTSISNAGLSLDWLGGDGTNDSAVATFDVGGRTGRAFRYGYFEAQMKWSPAAGAWPAFWLLSLDSATSNGQWGELDAFEGQGLQPAMFFGTVHNWTAVNGGRTQTQNLPNYFSLGVANDYSQWHKYGVLWQPGSITWYYDGNPILTAPEPSIMNSQDVEMIFDMAEGVNWAQGSVAGVTAADLKLNVGSVRVWQHNPSITTISTNGIAFRGN